MRFGGPVVPLVNIRTATSGSGVIAAVAGVQQLRFGVERRYRDHRRPRLLADQLRQIVGAADDHRQVERRDVGRRAVVAAGRVDDDDRPARQKHAEERGDVRGSVAQHHADLAPVADHRLDPAGQRGEIAVGEP